ncbi:MAG: GatB/YqeY domain-containing protein [Geminicoccaceae bacterium]|nr:GatB/YqeY domain-containing protein [Geminicoccaceae bacterium]
MNASLKDASERGDGRAACTLRLVLAAIKEREHVGQGPLDEDEIQGLLRDMVEQRRHEVSRCENNAHLDLAEQEADEIRVLEGFLPPRLDRAQMGAAVEAVIHDLGATRLKDTGRVIAVLKERFDGQMDVCEAKRLVCQRLA